MFLISCDILDPLSVQHERRLCKPHNHISVAYLKLCPYNCCTSDLLSLLLCGYHKAFDVVMYSGEASVSKLSVYVNQA